MKKEYDAYANLEELLSKYNIPQKEIDKYKVTQEEVDYIMETMINQLVFSGVTPNKDGKPKMTIVGGQPGSGKGRLLQYSKAEIEEKNAVIVSLDEYRIYHPRIKTIMKRLKKNPTIFNYLTMDFAYKLEEAVLNKAMTEGYNIVCEVSLNTSHALIDRINRAKELGYQDIIINTMATDEFTSVIGAHERYEQEKAKGRTTKRNINKIHRLERNRRFLNKFIPLKEIIYKKAEPKIEIDYDFVVPRLVNASYHEQAYSNMLSSLETLEEYVDKIQIFRRGPNKPELEYTKEKGEKKEESPKEVVVRVREEEKQRNRENNRNLMQVLKTALINRNAKEEEYELIKEAVKIYNYNYKLNENITNEEIEL